MVRTDPTGAILEEYKELIKKGNFTEGHGWGKEGYGGYKAGSGGGDRFQGIVAYYYDGFHPDTYVEMNRCKWNSNLGKHIIPQTGRCPTERQTIEECDKCLEIPLDEIMSIHFTKVKPWYCVIQEDTAHFTKDLPLSKMDDQRSQKWLEFVNVWLDYRFDLEKRLETYIEVHANNTYAHGFCQGRDYVPVRFPEKLNIAIGAQ